MRNSKGQFIKGYKNGFEENLKLGNGWNKGRKGWINSGSFKKGHSLLGKGIGETIRGKKSPNYGKSLSWMIGDKNPNWKGGVTSENRKIRMSLKYKLWRITIFERDNYQCLIGGKKHGNKLQVDHIQPFSLYPELRFELNNGRTLCINCHKKYGWGANQYIKWAGGSAPTLTTTASKRDKLGFEVMSAANYDGVVIGANV